MDIALIGTVTGTLTLRFNILINVINIIAMKLNEIRFN